MHRIVERLGRIKTYSAGESVHMLIRADAYPDVQKLNSPEGKSCERGTNPVGTCLKRNDNRPAENRIMHRTLLNRNHNKPYCRPQGELKATR